MTTKEYVEIYNRYPFSEYSSYEGQEEDKKKLIEYNKALLKKYPWLEPFNVWSGKRITQCCDDGEKGFWPGCPEEHPEYNYDHTILDDMPNGWRVAFGDQMCEEIHRELIKCNFVNDYQITQIKEKYGRLHWYDNGTPVGKLSEDYEAIDVKYNDHTGYDRHKYVFVEDSRDNYTPMIYTEDGRKKWHTHEELEELNKDCIIHYKKYKVLEECTIPDIINKYEHLSEKVCIDCGKQNVPMYEEKGWINFVCEDCAKKRVKAYNKDEESGKYSISDLFYLPGERDDS